LLLPLCLFVLLLQELLLLQGWVSRMEMSKAFCCLLLLRQRRLLLLLRWRLLLQCCWHDGAAGHVVM
jgi:hypothetical protein